MTTPSTLATFLALTLTWATLPPLEAADWPSWRGPRFDGTAPDVDVLGARTFGLEVAWQRPLGSGYSAVVVAGDTVVTLFSDHTDDFVIALDASSGAERWRDRLGATYRGHDGSEDGPSSMPVIAGGQVYVLGPRGMLVALDLAGGKRMWQVDIAARYAPKVPSFGFTTSPLADGDLLFVSVGAANGHGFIAFDAATGAERWALGDDTVSYQSPILATLGGRRQIVALSNHRLVGIAPESGRALWSFAYHAGESGGMAEVVPLGGDRLLVQDARETMVLRFVSDQAAEPFETLWRAEVLGNVLSVPVVHGAYLYGFAGRFLTCVRLADGKKMWKSRPPGGSGIIVVDGHLVTFGKGGDVVIAEAVPDGYVEKARVHALDAEGVTYPSFANGRIFVRNTRAIAAVRVRDALPAVAAAGPAEPADAFEAFVRRAADAADPRAAVRAYMRDQSRFPIVLGERVHIVYWGAAQDVAIAGTMTAGADEEGMARIPGTDFFHRSYTLPADGRAEYWLNVDFGTRVADPLNPRRQPYSRWWWDFEVSELRMPGYRSPAWTVAPAPTMVGTVESFRFTSKGVGHERTIGVYLPPGYGGIAGQGTPKERYPVALFLRGEMWRTRGALPAMLDRAIASGVIAPLLGIFVGGVEALPWQETSGEAERSAFERMLLDDLIPALLERYRIRPSAAAHALVGNMDAGRPAIETALLGPGALGHAVLISAEWPPGIAEQVLATAARQSADQRPEITVRWSRADANLRAGGSDQAARNEQFLARLGALGFAVHGGEAADASGWWSWNLRAIEALGGMFPPSMPNP